MSKDVKEFKVGLFKLAPCHNWAHKDGKLKAVAGEEKKFQKFLKNIAIEKIKGLPFPTNKPIRLFIFQYFSSPAEYENKDLDNMVKTIADALEGVIYKDDCQVKTILAGKQLKDHRVRENFLYITANIEKEQHCSPSIKKIESIEKIAQFYEKAKNKKE